MCLRECTVNHCALLHLPEGGGNRTQDRPVSALHSTDGFRAHGNLAPPVDGGSLQRKCFKVGVLNFCVVQYGGKGQAAAAKVLCRRRLRFRRAPGCQQGRGQGCHLLGWAGAVLAAGQGAESTPFSPVLWESRKTAAAAIPTQTDDAPLPCRTPRLSYRRPHTPTTLPHTTAQHGFRVGARAPRRQRCRERV